MNEVYARLEWLDGYMISNLGNVMNLKTGNIFCGRINKKTGYREINIQLNGKTKYLLVHRLVAEAFCKKPNDGNVYEVNHINGIRTDERAENLEWVTHAQNLKHSYLIGNREYDVSPKAVIATNKSTGEQVLFSSIYKAARFFGISQGNICMCCQGKRPYAGGYFWEYAKEEHEQ